MPKDEMNRQAILILLLSAFLLLGCTQAPAETPTNKTATTNAANATTALDVTALEANAQRLFQQPGYARFSTTISFPSNLTEEQRAIAEFMQSLLQGQESALAWDNDTFRLDSHVGLLGETLNQTTYHSSNASLWCLDGECDAADTGDTEQRLDVARNALKSPYNFLKMPKNVEVRKAWMVTPTGSSTQAGRACDGFELALNQTYLNQTLYSVPAGELQDITAVKQAVLLKGMNTPLRTCLDRERGYVASIRAEIDLAVARNENELKGLVMTMTQKVTEFREPKTDDVQAPASGVPLTETKPSDGNILPLGSVFTGSDGTQYVFVGKQNGSYAINISNADNASCAPKQLLLPEWTTYECNGTAHLFLIEESITDEFQVAVTEYVIGIRAYDPTYNPTYVLAPNDPTPLSSLPLILMYEGATEEGESVLIGPWEGPCPTERLVLAEKAGTYACDGREYAVKADGKEEDGLRVKVLRKQ